MQRFAALWEKLVGSNVATVLNCEMRRLITESQGWNSFNNWET